MQTRRDQLHAWRFMTRRSMSALVTGEPDAVEPPMRRITLFTLAGVMIAVAVVAVFAIIGFLRPGGGSAWQAEGTVVVERETGARFVMIGDRLHPALNFSSAVLATGSAAEVNIELVARSRLAEAERGPLIGIPELPDSLPPAKDLLAGPVTACSQVTTVGSIPVAEVTVLVGSDDDARPLATDEAVWVELAGSGERHLLWRGQRHRMPGNVLDFPGQPVVVGSAFLNALRAGPALESPEIEGWGGDPGFSMAGDVSVGDLIQVTDDNSWRVVLADGLVPVDDVAMRLLRDKQQRGQRADTHAMSLAQLPNVESTAGAAALADQLTGLPTRRPELAEGPRSALGACVVYDADGVPALAVPSGTPARGQGDIQDGSGAGEGVADHVAIVPGAALLARAPKGEAVNLIAEPGRRYPAAGLAALAGFGYAEVDPVVLPAELLALIPTGEAFDPAAALQQHTR